MKTFINVLYRKILYKIPLKFLLLILVIVGVLYYNYINADYLNGLNYVDSVSSDGTNPFTLTMSNYSFPNNGEFIFCGKISYSNSTARFRFSQNINSYDTLIFQTYRGNGKNFFCIPAGYSSVYYVSNMNGGGIEFTMDMYYLSNSNYDITSGNPGYTSLQCQTEYNLIPISSVDQNYCTTNNLCPSQDCPVCPPSGGSGFSNVYINDILHIGAPTIVMNIPEEIDWDYGYTAGGYNMNIDVVGYNVDYEKIDNIVDNQSYKPSSEDFANILGILAPYTKIIVFFVFLFLVWAWIKKPFKSKKL